MVRDLCEMVVREREVSEGGERPSEGGEKPM